MQNIYSIDITLKTDSVDLTERWTMSGVLNAMQLAADNHAVILGAGKDHIIGRGHYWVIARTRIDIERYPRYQDGVTVTTWPGTPDRLTFPRYFKFSDEHGQTLGTATVKYMLMDSETHSFVLPKDAEIYPKSMAIHPEINPSPEKIRFSAPTQQTAYRTPSYSDIDINRHMNNTRYAQWACDLFPTSQYESNSIARFQINYVSDGIEGHNIALDVQHDDDSMNTIIKGTDTENNKTVFECAIVWTKI